MFYELLYRYRFSGECKQNSVVNQYVTAENRVADIHFYIHDAIFLITRYCNVINMK